MEIFYRRVSDVEIVFLMILTYLSALDSGLGAGRLVA